MSRRLPSFPSLRAFEAAARHLSFTAAAEELCVTQSAISHQVRILEDFLGAPLFIRHPQSVELTLRGSEYQATVSFLMDGLESATQEIRGKDVSGPLYVQASAAFASCWFIPRILRFNRLYPDIELNLSTIGTDESTSQQPFDVRINCSWEEPPGSESEAFISSGRMPVCSPELLKNGPAISEPEDLLKYPILREDESWDRWDQWFSVVGFEEPPQTTGPRLENPYLTLRAAEDGQGIALSPVIYIAGKIALGTLIPLFKAESATKLFYTITFTKNWKHQPRIVAFREWLHKEARPRSELDGSVDWLRAKTGTDNLTI